MAGTGGTSPAPASSGTTSANQATVAAPTRLDTSVTRTSDPRTCCQIQYGGAAAASHARPHATTHPCPDASAAACSASAVLPMPGSPTRCTTRAVPRRAAAIAAVIVASSRARPTSTPADACAPTPLALPDVSATTWSPPSTVGCQPGGMSTSPGGVIQQRGDLGSRLRARRDVAQHGARVGVLGRGHEQPGPEGRCPRSAAGRRRSSPARLCALRPLRGQAYQGGEGHGT